MAKTTKKTDAETPAEELKASAAAKPATKRCCRKKTDTATATASSAQSTCKTKSTAASTAKNSAEEAPVKNAAKKTCTSRGCKRKTAEEKAQASTPNAGTEQTKTAAKPAARKTTAKSEPKVTVAEPPKDKEAMTPEEKERSRKLRATLALLKADPEWPDFLREQREALLNLRDELAPSVHNTTRDHLRSGDSNLSSSSGQHIGDAGSDAEVRALTISLLDKDREQLFEIDAALERIRRGTYGICEISLEPIPKGRLRVRPFCRLTVKCQEEYEKKYGSYANYKAKNQDSVGFAGLQNDTDDAISLDDSEE